MSAARRLQSGNLRWREGGGWLPMWKAGAGPVVTPSVKQWTLWAQGVGCICISEYDVANHMFWCTKVQWRAAVTGVMACMPLAVRSRKRVNVGTSSSSHRQNNEESFTGDASAVPHRRESVCYSFSVRSNGLDYADLQVKYTDSPACACLALMAASLFLRASISRASSSSSSSPSASFFSCAITLAAT